MIFLIQTLRTVPHSAQMAVLGILMVIGLLSSSFDAYSRVVLLVQSYILEEPFMSIVPDPSKQPTRPYLTVPLQTRQEESLSVRLDPARRFALVFLKTTYALALEVAFKSVPLTKETTNVTADLTSLVMLDLALD
jgi:hypothetical protein